MQVVILALASVFLSSCSTGENRALLDEAETMITTHPDSALLLLEDIPEHVLSNLEKCQYIYIKTRAMAKTTREITWPEEMHRAAVQYEFNARPLDVAKAADYYYFSALAYKWNGYEIKAIVDWIRCAELLEPEVHNNRLYAAYESLYLNYFDQMMGDECREYAVKALQVARELNDTAKIVSSLNFLATEIMNEVSYDSVYAVLSEAIRLSSAINDTKKQVWTYKHMIELHNQYDKLEEAALYGDTALRLSEFEDKSIFFTVGITHQKRGNISEAVASFLKGYSAMNLSGRYWSSRYLYDISKLPGYDTLAHYGDSVIYYNSKFDHEEKSQDITQAIADYRKSQSDAALRQLAKSFGIAALIVSSLLGVGYVWKSVRTKRRLERLEKIIRDQHAQQIMNPGETESVAGISDESLRIHYEAFITTDVYRSLLKLDELKPGQLLPNGERDALVGKTLAGFYNAVLPILRGKELTNEDLFLCLMYYMKFATRDVAAVLGVTEAAVRKRKSRARKKLEELGYSALALRL